MNAERDRLGAQMGWVPPVVDQLSDQGPWINEGKGHYLSKSTGMRKYVPNEDPDWHADLKRIAGGR